MIECPPKGGNSIQPLPSQVASHGGENDAQEGSHHPRTVVPKPSSDRPVNALTRSHKDGNYGAEHDGGCFSQQTRLCSAFVGKDFGEYRDRHPVKDEKRKHSDQNPEDGSLQEPNGAPLAPLGSGDTRAIRGWRGLLADAGSLGLARD